jgi:hypothetical protein
MAVTVEGLDALKDRWSAVVHDLEDDLARGSLDAADYGVSTMQESHPYQDRTYNLSGSMHVVPATDGEGKREAELRVDAEYASFVDQGTSRNRAYPFMSLGEHAAAEALQTNAQAAADAAAARMNG